MRDGEAVAETVDQGLLGTNVDVCSGNKVNDSVSVVVATDAGASELELCTASMVVVAAEVLVEASDSPSACHVQIQPVFEGSTEQIISDAHVRIVFHLSSKHPA
jgi:hypothetical protein